MCLTADEQQQQTTVSHIEVKKEDIAQKKLEEIGFFQKPEMTDIDARFESEKQVLTRFLNFDTSVKDLVDFKGNEIYVQSELRKQREAEAKNRQAQNQREDVNINARYANYNEKADNKQNDKKKKRAASARKKGLNVSYNEAAHMLNCMEEDDKAFKKRREGDEKFSLGYVFANFNITKDWKNDDDEPCKRFRDKKGYLSKSTKLQQQWYYDIAQRGHNEANALGFIKVNMFKKKDLSHFTPEYISKNMEAVWDELKLLQGAEMLFGQEGAYRNKLTEFEQKRMDTVIGIAHFAERMFNKSLEIMGIKRGRKSYEIGKVTQESLLSKKAEMEAIKREFDNSGLDMDKDLETEILSRAKVNIDENVEYQKDNENIRKQAKLKQQKGEELSEEEKRVLNTIENPLGLVVPTAVDHAEGGIDKIKKLINTNPKVYEDNKSTIDPLLNDLRVSLEMMDKADLMARSVSNVLTNESESDLEEKRVQMESDLSKDSMMAHDKVDAIINMIKFIFKPEEKKNVDYKTASILNHYYPDLFKAEYLEQLKEERKTEIKNLYGKDIKMPEDLKDLSVENLKVKIDKIKSIMDKVNFNKLFGKSSKEYLGQIANVKEEILAYGNDNLALLHNQIMRQDMVTAGLFENEKEQENFGLKMEILENASLVYRWSKIDAYLAINPQVSEADIFEVLNEEEKSVVTEAINGLSPEMIAEYKKLYDVEDESEFRRKFIYSKVASYIRTIIENNSQITKRFQAKLE